MVLVTRGAAGEDTAATRPRMVADRLPVGRSKPSVPYNPRS